MSATIAVDAMGGDHAPEVIVKGALRAARTLAGVSIILVGDETRIREVIGSDSPLPSNVRIEHTTECIGMDDSPYLVMRKKRNCSLGIAARLVAEGQAGAFFSAGNSGACMAAALFHLRPIEGVDRPAIATILPNWTGHFLLLDAGANTDCHEHNLLEFALMGSVYASRVMGKVNPTVGLVSNGEEEGKGDSLTKSAASILKLMPINFIGNIEGTAIYTGKADVIVCDGFVGNVILKTSESAAEFLQNTIKREAMKSPITKLGGFLMKPAFRRVKKISDYAEVGGAPLLGVRGGAVVGHGRSNENAAFNGIRQAVNVVQSDLVSEIEVMMKKNRDETFVKFQAI